MAAPEPAVHNVLPGGWLPTDGKVIRKFIRDLKKKARENPMPLVAPIQELKDMVEDKENELMRANFQLMFTFSSNYSDEDDYQVKSFDEFLKLLNVIMKTAPMYTAEPSANGPKPTGLIAFPINALLNWPMATRYGYEVFSNQLINEQFRKILNYWCTFLQSEGSRYVLKYAEGPVITDPGSQVSVYSWVSPTAQKEMVHVATTADPDNSGKSFDQIYKCDPNAEYYGYKSWDDFFLREFKDGLRPLASGDDIIANACEAAPLQLVQNVKLADEFWVKSQPYSLVNVMNSHPFAAQFDGGTVYQGFLSALSYHRWHSPVSGTVKASFVVNGSYYLQNRHVHDDAVAPNDSQAFLMSVAARVVIFIESDNPLIGLMCFVAAGMSEVGSCESVVKEGQHIEKGDPLGMFHFGGSTHCLIFRRGVGLKTFWSDYRTSPGLDATNVPVKAKIFQVYRTK